MSIIDQAKSHFSATASSHIDVPEWGQAGKPLRIFHRRMTVAQRRRIWRDESGATVDGNIAIVRAVLFQAVDRQGKRLFDDMDEHALTHEVDSEVVARVGAQILGFVKGQAVSADSLVGEAKND
ncbi:MULTISPECIES: hypothetical protein [unclassified Ensifer]|uniref:hypothetical protein n=1 Tax=unclassified Ensifer TaxID=2633371 RepID=UPI0007106BD6|nr:MULTISPECIES: hypothetical protein [unclassified Ensifer]KQW62861.1 hypothetical protein ASD02_01695 [Ensifer sp. Root1252]KRC83682.1 hypothetical protein ASE32_01685 [Ensifer sp. Root231]KRD04035.1 hypothetical protein ASE47_00345 [Ensifer sp. Root258]